MTRKEELLKCFENIDNSQKCVIIRMVEEMVFLEGQLDFLRTKPLIKFHPTNPELQKPTAAGKLYKEYLQQYNNIVKTLSSVLRRVDATEDSPLRAYFKQVGADG